MIELENIFINNFPLAISIFLLFAIIVSVIATIVTKIAIAIRDKKTQISDGVIGGILISAITSVPELITSISFIINAATIEKYDNPGAVFGDVIGSNMCCILILAITLIVVVKMFKHRTTDQINAITIICLIFGSVMCVLAILFDNNGIIYGGDSQPVSPLVWHGFNFFSIFIFISYALAVFFMVAESKIKLKKSHNTNIAVIKNLQPKIKRKQSRISKLNFKFLVLFLVIGVVVLTGSSIVLSTACGGCITHWQIGPVFGRTLLLGIATSLPELIAVVTLAINKRYNIVINSMVGSCAFNMIILTFCNITYAALWTAGQDPMFPKPDAINSVVTELVLFILMCLFICLYIIINSRQIKMKLTDKQIILANVIILALVIFLYVIYIVLGIIEWNANQNSISISNNTIASLNLSIR